MFFHQNDSKKATSDAELARRCQAFEPAAQRLLFERYRGRLMGFCLRYFRRREIAEEVFQEGWTRFFQKIDRFDPAQPVFPFLKKVALRAGLNFLRQHFSPQKATEGWSDALENELFEAEPLDWPGGDFDQLLALLGGLPPDDATILQLALVEDYSHDEIAELLQISAGASRVRLLRARKKLVAALTAETQKSVPNLSSSTAPKTFF